MRAPSISRIKRNSSRKAIHEIFGIAPAGTGAFELRSLITQHCAWIFSKLSKGESVNIRGVGSFGFTWRRERTVKVTAKKVPVFQPNQFVVKFKASPALKEKLHELSIAAPEGSPEWKAIMNNPCSRVPRWRRRGKDNSEELHKEQNSHAEKPKA